MFRLRLLFAHIRRTRRPPSRGGHEVGCAVERNRARRVMREIFRKNAPDFARPCDIIIFVRRGWDKFDFRTLDEKFAKAARWAISKQSENAALQTPSA